MTYDDFIGEVQNRARLASREDALKATRATLSVLNKRLYGGESKDLTAQLPEELKHLIKVDTKGDQEKFDLDEFFDRVSEKEGVDKPKSVHHARAVIAVLNEAVTAGEMGDVRAQLPEGYTPLFDSGSEGNMKV